MDQIIWKNKLVVLWLFQIFNFIALLLIPETFSNISTEIGEGMGGLIIFYIFLSCLMIWMAVVLKPKLSRLPIIVIAIFYSSVKIQWIMRGMTEEYSVEFLFNEIWGLFAAALIIWYGWKIPNAELNK